MIRRLCVFPLSDDRMLLPLPSVMLIRFVVLLRAVEANDATAGLLLRVTVIFAETKERGLCEKSPCSFVFWGNPSMPLV